jgi:RNA polymerase sigma-70 factor (ECF subfamily)
VEGGVSVGPGSDSESGEDTHREFMQLADTALLGSYRLAGHILADRTEAEDAVQEALVLAWRGWPRLRDATRFDAWFDRILLNVCYERLRGRKRLRSEVLPGELAGTGTDPFGPAIARDVIGRALHALTPEQRIVIVLRYWRELSIEEISERLRIPSGTVRSRLHYALRTLRSEIDDAASGPVEVPS